MRLVCPNCDAKYEVPDDAVPEGGRDVQCSSCGHAWFQMRPEAEIAAEEEAALFGDDLPPPVEEATETETQAEPEVAPEPAVEAEAKPESVAEVAPEPAPAPVDAPSETDAAIAALLSGSDATATGTEAEPAEAEVPPADTPPRRDLDDGVLAILREEAEREEEARRTEAQKSGARRAEAEGQMQVQPELGVEAAAPAAALSPTQRRLAMLKGEDPDAPPPEPAKPAARRDLLPDVEEINSTLQPSEGSDDPDAEIDALPDLTRRRSGFRSGFFLMILLLVVAAAVYIAAPKLVAQFPAMEGALTAYVAGVDGLRIWLNDLMNSATQALNGGDG